jgi:hypothetical protein
MQFKKSEYPLVLLTAIENLYKVLAKEIKQDYDELVDVEIGTKEIYLKITPKDESIKFDFFFSVLNPFLIRNEPAFTVYHKPWSHVKLEGSQVDVYYKDILETTFLPWVSIIKRYSEIQFNEDDIFIKKYTEEFYEEFKIIDDDAEISPFNNEQQIAIYKLLSDVEQRLNNEAESNPKIEEVIEEIQDLKNKIQNSTKATVIKVLSKIFAKIKKHGIKLMIDIFDIAKKEAIKRVLSGGIDEISNTIHHLP